MRAVRLTKQVVYGLLAAALAVALVLKPALILYAVAAVLYVIVVAVIYYSIYVQSSIDDTYRIPGTQIVLRTTFDPWSLATAPFLEVRNGEGAPLRFCMHGPSLTRADLYSVEGGGVLLETARDTFLIKTAPFSVEGPRSWMVYGVLVNEHGQCDYDARGSPPDHERLALKAGLKLTHVGAFVTGQDGYRRFVPAPKWPVQKIAPGSSPILIPGSSSFLINEWAAAQDPPRAGQQCLRPAHSCAVLATVKDEPRHRKR